MTAALEKISSAAIFGKDKPMTFFENELKKMFGNNSALTDIRYTGNALVGRLTDDTIAKITFAHSINHGHYPGLLIKVINPKSGEADRQEFNFSDVFGQPKGVYVYDNDREVFWRGFKPGSREYEKINLAAEQYLEMFLEPVQDMRMSM